MNPVTFNDIFLRFFRKPTDSATDNRRAAAAFARTPLFDYESHDIEEKDKDIVRSIVFDEEGRMCLPFACLRAYLHPNPEAKPMQFGLADGSRFDLTTGGMKIVAFQGRNPEDNPCTWLLIDAGNLVGGGGTGFLQCWYRLRSISASSLGGTMDLEAGPAFFDSKRDFRNVTNAIPSSSLRKISEAMASLFVAFLFDVNLPSNHIAKVSPDKPGKSVQWRESREHYVILDRRHKANSADVKEGQAVEHDEAKNRERISHSRRAHWRTFRHERYKAAKGKRIRIKSLWIGPKVWRDLTGSTYQIIR